MENSRGFRPVKLASLKKIDPEMIDKIIKRRGIEREKVEQMMVHDTWTVGQFADLTGKDESTINNLIVRGRQKELNMVTALNICFPWPRLNTSGAKHIIRDELSMGILIKSLE